MKYLLIHRKVIRLLWFFSPIALILLGCSQHQITSLQTQVAQLENTAIIVIQTEAPPIETMAAEAASTALSEGIKIVQTQSSVLKKTIVAGVSTMAANPSVTPVATKQAVIDYFALGDSIASGHGIMDDGTPCYRSTRSYPHKLIEILKTRYEKINWTILACSGATASRPSDEIMQEDSNKWLRNQVDFVIDNLSDRPTLISITIGANDFGWSDPQKMLPHLGEPADEYLHWVNITAESIKGELISSCAIIQRSSKCCCRNNSSA